MNNTITIAIAVGLVGCFGLMGCNLNKESNSGSEVLQGGNAPRAIVCDSTQERGAFKVTYQVKFRYDTTKKQAVAAKVQASGSQSEREFHSRKGCIKNCQTWTSNVDLTKQPSLKGWYGFRTADTMVFRIENTDFQKNANGQWQDINLTHFPQPGEGFEKIDVVIKGASCRNALFY